MIVYRYFVVLLVSLMLVGTVSAANWYVDNAASGGNGQSWGSAWNSFSNIGWSSVGPGDTIYISGGSSSKTYHEQLNPPDTFDGTSGNEITITVGVDSNHNGQVTIDGDLIRNCVELSSNDYVIVGGNAGNSIRCIEGGTGSGSIYAQYGSHFTVQYWEFPDYNTRGMVYVQKDNDNFVISHITGDNIDSSNQNDGIVVQTGGPYTVTDFVIEYVTWRDDNTNTVQHIDCMQLGTTNYAVHNGIVRNNHCIQNNNKVANSQGIFTEHFGGVWYVYNNLVEYNTGNPLKFKTDYQGGKVYLYSNTLIKKGVSDRHLARVGGADSVVKNNIFYRVDNQQTALNFYDTLTDPTNQVDYNIYYRGGASTSIIDVHGYVIDPSLDSQWRPDSANDPPVDKGIDLSSIFMDDKDGNARGAAWDIGAYEFGGSVSFHPADLNQNGCVDIGEIVSYVDLWKNAQVSIQEVVVGVEKWQQGCP